jgi:hypothetical protein
MKCDKICSYKCLTCEDDDEFSCITCADNRIYAPTCNCPPGTFEDQATSFCPSKLEFYSNLMTNKKGIIKYDDIITGKFTMCNPICTNNVLSSIINFGKIFSQIP